MKNYIFNLETTKIELHFEKTEYDALTDEQKRELKKAFLWSRSGNCWVSRAKEPNLWRAKEVAKKLGFTEEQREGERLSYAEQLERQTERAEARADRYEGYAVNASKRGEQMQSELKSFHGDISFFTQPNINSSSGRSFTNYRNRLFERYNKGFEEYHKSDYFRERAETARGTASQAQFDNPAYLERRIKECKKRIKVIEESLASYEETLYKLEQGEEVKNHAGEPIPIERIKSRIKYLLEQYEITMDKQGYLENYLNELGGIKFSKDNIKAGYIVRIRHVEKAEIISVGSVNVGYKILTGGAAGMTLTAAYAEIKEVLKAEEKKREPHPFKVGEQFEIKKYVKEPNSYGGYKSVTVKVMYEIVKTSATTIQLKPVGTEEKTITRKPAKTYSGSWRFSVDDIYGNTFYKYADGTVKSGRQDIS